MKTLIILLFPFLLFGQLEKHGKIAFFGDSWVNSGNLHEYFYDAFSYGVPGATAERLYSHVDSVIVRKPDTVILIVGVNDYVQRVGADDFGKWKVKIEHRFWKAGIVAWILQIPDADYENAYDNFLGEWARNFRAWWRDTHNETLEDYKGKYHHITFPEMKPEHYRDPVHLNQEGIKVLAEHIKRYLKK